ncbi:MAG TPA: tetratricopeptide repeat protein [Opitutaceae bacterium]|nr:tetratricopeptide repeat protein [Opitutaceae bacterium]
MPNVIAVISLVDWDSLMSRKSRARAAAKAATSAKAPTTSRTLSPPGPKTFLARWDTLLASGIVVLAALAAYHNSFSGPFFFDDTSAITANSTIRHFESAFSPSPKNATFGRPLINLSFALNYALGGMKVWGYHALNLLIHTLAGLTLFGIVRRTLASRLATRGFQISNLKSKIVESPATAQSEISNLRFEMPQATLLALAVAVIWVVHPLQTEAVTYISQRAESLMGLFYLLTLYCFVRSTKVEKSKVQSLESKGTPTSSSQLSTLSSGLWLSGSVLACLLGVMSKEIIVTAPVMVLLYDRTFVAGSFREAWRQRWRYYLGLAGTWLLLARLMTGLTQRGVGFGDAVPWWNYALTSCRSVGLYLKLAFWPHPLIFDYGTNAIVVQHATEILPYAVLLAVLLVGTAIALWRWPAVGFAGVWLFLILAPTSSVVPVILSPMAEHRMYLPLAAIVAVVVLGLHRWMGRRSLILFAAIAVGLGCLTIHRNKDYYTKVSIWRDDITKRPGNERAHLNLGIELSKIPDRMPDAIAEYQAALVIKPDFAEAHSNLGYALSQIPGRLQDAVPEYEAALRIKPDYLQAHLDLGVVLSKIPGRLQDAITQYEEALRINPESAEAHLSLGLILMNIPDRQQEAIVHLKAALRGVTHAN